MASVSIKIAAAAALLFRYLHHKRPYARHLYLPYSASNDASAPGNEMLVREAAAEGGAGGDSTSALLCQAPLADRQRAARRSFWAGMYDAPLSHHPPRQQRLSSPLTHSLSSPTPSHLPFFLSLPLPLSSW